MCLHCEIADMIKRYMHYLGWAFQCVLSQVPQQLVLGYILLINLLFLLWFQLRCSVKRILMMRISISIRVCLYKSKLGLVSLVPLTREQISCRLVAMALAGVSQRNTWHFRILVFLSRATYAKSLGERKTKGQWRHKNEGKRWGDEDERGVWWNSCGCDFETGK